MKQAISVETLDVDRELVLRLSDFREKQTADYYREKQLAEPIPLAGSASGNSILPWERDDRHWLRDEGYDYHGGLSSNGCDSPYWMFDNYELYD